jgi:hypothetical protein
MREILYEMAISFLQCHIQWSLAHPVPGIRICTMFDKELSHFEVSFSRCQMQRSLVSPIPGIRICATFEELSHFQVSS